jgi:tetratricopeptide (TPR) repeat protein
VGAKTQQYFVTREDGAYKIVTDGKDPSEAGNETLFLLGQGKEAEARALLDWMRDSIHKGGGDDPLSGPLFPRFWNIDGKKDAPAMKLAAASLIADRPNVRDLVPSIEAAREKADGEERVDLELLLGHAYWVMEDGHALKTIGAEVLEKYPESYVAIGLAGDADALLKDWSDWNTMLDSRIAKHPDDEQLLKMKVESAEAQNDFAMARATEQKLMDAGKATAADYNNYAWTALFDEKVDADSAKSAQQATMLTHDSTFPELHTLACVYAYLGKTSEARDLLLKAMTAANLTEPNSEVWFGFGRIYEQYGVNDAAIEAYKKVEKPQGRIAPGSTYLLAQQRLKALNAADNAGKTAGQ